jgi:hypothetical protein
MDHEQIIHMKGLWNTYPSVGANYLENELVLISIQKDIYADKWHGSFEFYIFVFWKENITMIKLLYFF